MGKGERLRKGSQFTTVYSQGKTWATNLVLIKALPNGLDYNRYGFVAGKRLGKAVIRNRIKRLLREIVRATPTKQGWDIILIARINAANSNYQELNHAVEVLLKRAGIINHDDCRIECKVEG